MNLYPPLNYHLHHHFGFHLIPKEETIEGNVMRDSYV